MKKTILIAIFVLGLIASTHVCASNMQTKMEEASIDIENAYNDTKQGVGNATSTMHTKIEETGIDIENAYDDTKKGIKKWNNNMKLKWQQKKKFPKPKQCLKNSEGLPFP